MDEVNRRKFRPKLGTRQSRREGTKTKGMPGGASGSRGKAGKPTRKQCYRFPRRQRARPSVQLEQMIKKSL